MNIQKTTQLAEVSPATVNKALNSQYNGDSSVYIHFRKIMEPPDRKIASATDSIRKMRFDFIPPRGPKSCRFAISESDRRLLCGPCAKHPDILPGHSSWPDGNYRTIKATTNRLIQSTWRSRC